MRGRGYINQTRGKSSFPNTVHGRNSKKFNFDIQSYQFDDLDFGLFYFGLYNLSFF